MKHLKTYNESINRQDIKEICYDITDEGKFEVSFGDTSFSGIKYIVVRSSKNYPEDRTFKLDDVIEVIQRILDYLGDSYHEMMIRYNREGDGDVRFSKDETLQELINLNNRSLLSQICWIKDKIYNIGIYYKDI